MTGNVAGASTPIKATRTMDAVITETVEVNESLSFTGRTDSKK